MCKEMKIPPISGTLRRILRCLQQVVHYKILAYEGKEGEEEARRNDLFSDALLELLYLAATQTKDCEWNDVVEKQITPKVCYALRHCLLSSTREVSSATLRTMRHFLLSDRILQLMVDLSFPEFVSATIEQPAEPGDEYHHVAALRFVRRWCILSAFGQSSVAPPDCFIRCIAEICSEEALSNGVGSISNALLFKLNCYKTLRDLCVTHTELVVKCGGASVLTDALIDIQLAELDASFCHSVALVLALMLSTASNTGSSNDMGCDGCTVGRERCPDRASSCTSSNKLPLHLSVWDVEIARLCGLFNTSTDCVSSNKGTQWNGISVRDWRYDRNPSWPLKEEESKDVERKRRTRKMWTLGANALLTLCTTFSGLFSLAYNPYGFRALIQQLRQSLCDDLILWIVYFFRSLISIALGLKGDYITEENRSRANSELLSYGPFEESSAYRCEVYDTNINGKQKDHGNTNSETVNPFVYPSSSRPTSSLFFTHHTQGLDTISSVNEGETFAADKATDPNIADAELLFTSDENDSLRVHYKHSHTTRSLVVRSDLRENLKFMVFRILLDCNLHYALAALCLRSRDSEDSNVYSSKESVQTPVGRIPLRKLVYKESSRLLSIFIYAACEILPDQSLELLSRVFETSTRFSAPEDRSMMFKLQALLAPLSHRLSLSHTSLTGYSFHHLYKDSIGSSGDSRTNLKRNAFNSSKFGSMNSTLKEEQLKLLKSHICLKNKRSIAALLKRFKLLHTTSSFFDSSLHLLSGRVMHLKLFIEHSNVLSKKEYWNWNWEAILKLLTDPLTASIEHTEDQLVVTRFFRRLLYFYSPRNNEFASIPWEIQNVKYVWIGMYLLFFLLHKSDFGKAEGLYTANKMCFVGDLMDALEGEIKDAESKRTTKNSELSVHSPKYISWQSLRHSPSAPCFDPSIEYPIRGRVSHDRTPPFTPAVASSLPQMTNSNNTFKQYNSALHESERMGSVLNAGHNTPTASKQLWNTSYPVGMGGSSKPHSPMVVQNIPRVGRSGSPCVEADVTSPLVSPTTSANQYFNRNTSSSRVNDMKNQNIYRRRNSSTHALNEMNGINSLISQRESHFQNTFSISVGSSDSGETVTNPSSYETKSVSTPFSEGHTQYTRPNEIPGSATKPTVFSQKHVDSSLTREYVALIAALSAVETGDSFLKATNFYTLLTQLVDIPVKDYLTGLFIRYTDLQTKDGLSFMQQIVHTGSYRLKCIAIERFEDFFLETDCSPDALPASFHLHNDAAVSWGTNTCYTTKRNRVLSDSYTYDKEVLNARGEAAPPPASSTNRPIVLNIGAKPGDPMSQTETRVDTAIADKEMVGGSEIGHGRGTMRTMKASDTALGSLSRSIASAPNIVALLNRKDARQASPPATGHLPKLFALPSISPNILKESTGGITHALIKSFIMESILSIALDKRNPTDLIDTAFGIVCNHFDLLDASMVTHMMDALKVYPDAGFVNPSSCMPTEFCLHLLQFDAAVEVLKSGGWLKTFLDAYMKLSHFRPTNERREGCYYYVELMELFIRMAFSASQPVISKEQKTQYSATFLSPLDDMNKLQLSYVELREAFPQSTESAKKTFTHPRDKSRGINSQGMFKWMSDTTETNISHIHTCSIPLRLCIQLIGPAFDTSSGEAEILRESYVDGMIWKQPDQRFMQLAMSSIEPTEWMEEDRLEHLKKWKAHMVIADTSSNTKYCAFIGEMEENGNGGCVSCAGWLSFDDVETQWKKKWLGNIINVQSFPKEYSVVGNGHIDCSVLQECGRGGIRIGIEIGKQYAGEQGKLTSKGEAWWDVIEFENSLKKFRTFLTHQVLYAGEDTQLVEDECGEATLLPYYLVITTSSARVVVVADISTKVKQERHGDIRRGRDLHEGDAPVEFRFFLAKISANINFVGDVYAVIRPPTSILSYLSCTPTGCAILEESNYLEYFKRILNEKECSAMELKSVLWSIGQIGCSEDGALLLHKKALLSDAVKTAIHHPLSAIRGMSMHVFSMLPMSPTCIRIMQTLGWDLKQRGPIQEMLQEFIGGSVTKQMHPSEESKEYEAKKLPQSEHMQSIVWSSPFDIYQPLNGLQLNVEPCKLELSHAVEWFKLKFQIREHTRKSAPSHAFWKWLSNFSRRSPSTNRNHASPRFPLEADGRFSYRTAEVSSSAGASYLADTCEIGVAGKDFEVIQKPLSDTSADDGKRSTTEVDRQRTDDSHAATDSTPTLSREKPPNWCDRKWESNGYPKFDANRMPLSVKWGPEIVENDKKMLDEPFEGRSNVPDTTCVHHIKRNASRGYNAANEMSTQTLDTQVKQTTEKGSNRVVTNRRDYAFRMQNTSDISADSDLDLSEYKLREGEAKRTGEMEGRDGMIDNEYSCGVGGKRMGGMMSSPTDCFSHYAPPINTYWDKAKAIPSFLVYSNEHVEILKMISSLLNPVTTKNKNLTTVLRSYRDSQPEVFRSVELWCRVRLLMRIYHYPLSSRRFLSKLFDETFQSFDALCFLDVLQNHISTELGEERSIKIDDTFDAFER